MINYYYLGAAGGIVVLLLLGIVWLLFAQARLKRELRAQSDMLHQHSQDIAGLCSAAITLGERLESDAEVLTSLQSALVDTTHDEAIEQPLNNLIQKVRAGATAADLMQNFGLSRDEATLLIRLHGHSSGRN